MDARGNGSPPELCTALCTLTRCGPGTVPELPSRLRGLTQQARKEPLSSLFPDALSPDDEESFRGRRDTGSADEHPPHTSISQDRQAYWMMFDYLEKSDSGCLRLRGRGQSPRRQLPLPIRPPADGPSIHCPLPVYPSSLSGPACQCRGHCVLHQSFVRDRDSRAAAGN